MVRVALAIGRSTSRLSHWSTSCTTLLRKTPTAAHSMGPRRPRDPMIYQTYQAYADFMVPIRLTAELTAALMRPPYVAPFMEPWLGGVAAAWQMLAQSRLTHERPAYGIDRVLVGGREVAVREIASERTPFATLLHFEKDMATSQPRVLLVAPMSGHFATLLRGTVRTMLPDH